MVKDLSAKMITGFLIFGESFVFLNLIKRKTMIYATLSI